MHRHALLFPTLVVAGVTSLYVKPGQSVATPPSPPPPLSPANNVISTVIAAIFSQSKCMLALRLYLAQPLYLRMRWFLCVMVLIFELYTSCLLAKQPPSVSPLMMYLIAPPYLGITAVYVVSGGLFL